MYRGGRSPEGRANGGLVVRRWTPAAAGQPLAQDSVDQAVRPVNNGHCGRLRSAEDDERIADAASASAPAARCENGDRRRRIHATRLGRGRPVRELQTSDVQVHQREQQRRLVRFVG